MNKNTFISRQQFLSTLVLVCGVVCFFLGGIALLTHEHLFTSWWLIDWLIFALPTHFFLSLLGVTKQKKSTLGYIFLSITLTLIIVSRISGYGGVRTFFLGILRGLAGRYMYRNQRQWLLSRRRRSARGYIASQVALWGSWVSFLTTVSVISTIGHTGINCSQLEESLRFSGLQQQLDVSSLGSFLGADAFLASQAPTGTGTNTSSGAAPGLLGLFGVAKSQIYDVIVEQKELLNHSLCGLINTQLITIQHRPWRQVAGIILLYILMRPLVSILVRICMPLWILIRNILVRSKIIKKQKKRVMITGLILE